MYRHLNILKSLYSSMLILTAPDSTGMFYYLFHFNIHPWYKWVFTLLYQCSTKYSNFAKRNFAFDELFNSVTYFFAIAQSYRVPSLKYHLCSIRPYKIPIINKLQRSVKLSILRYIAYRTSHHIAYCSYMCINLTSAKTIITASFFHSIKTFVCLDDCLLCAILR